VFERIRNVVVTLLGVALCLFTLVEVNFPQLQQQSALAVFVMLGMTICFLVFPVHKRFENNVALRATDVLLALATVVCCGFVIVQSEPWLQQFWMAGEKGGIQSLTARASDENSTDFAIGLIGLFLVLEVTRRSIGWIVPALALLFVGHSFYCYLASQHGWAAMPDMLFPHQGQSLKSIASTTFLQTLGVFGPAAGVMFKYVFLFVVFGSFLEMSGATQFIIDFAERVFGRSPGGPAKISVLGSGLMGSLSGSAVANAVTTGAFTIPMMRNSGFEPRIAGGITAAAAAGGALVPPVMGAGAYMMLELVEPQVTFLQIATAALLPAVLYYFSIYMIVHYYSRRIGAQNVQKSAEDQVRSLWQFEAIVFVGALVALVGLLLMNFSPFRAVTGSLVLILLLGTMRKRLKLATAPRIFAITSFFVVILIHQFSPQILKLLPDSILPYIQWAIAYVAKSWLDLNTGDLSILRIFESLLDSSIFGMLGMIIFGTINRDWRPTIINALTKSAKNGVSLVAASACVGIIIGIVQQTGIAADFSAAIRDQVESNLLMALVGIMACSIVLGMGVPSVVCYLLMATLMGSLLSELGIIPLAAHLFIFYFGMMSMVTPPVALAAYASASIAGSRIMPTALAAFRFSLVGFTLPFMFVYRPELLLMSDKPEVTVKLMRPKEVKVGEPAPINGKLVWYGEPRTFSKIEIATAQGDSAATTLRTNDFGTFRSEVDSGDWIITTYDRERIPLNPATISELTLTADQRIETGDDIVLFTGEGTVVSPSDLEEDDSGTTFYLTQDGEPLHLGSLTFDPSQTNEEPTGSGAAIDDNRLQFTDQRLSMLSVALAMLAALVGIVALAAGIAGYMSSDLRTWVRVLMLFAAALLLSPDLEIGGTQIGAFTNIVGGALFAVLVVINRLKTNAESPAATP
jgi:TRAP transporter 4TM/12TM fusion protein